MSARIRTEWAGDLSFPVISVSYSAGHYQPHLAASRRLHLAEKEEHQGTAAVFGHPDNAIKSQNPGGGAEGSGDIQCEESFVIKTIAGFRCLKVCLLEEIKFGCGVGTVTFLFHIQNIFVIVNTA